MPRLVWALAAACVVVVDGQHYKANFDGNNLHTLEDNARWKPANQANDQFSTAEAYDSCGSAYGPMSMSQGRYMGYMTSYPGDLPAQDNQWTLSFYVKVTAVGATPRDCIVSFGTCGVPDRRESFTIGFLGAGGGKFRFRAKLDQLNGDPKMAIPSRYDTNEWYRVVIIYKGGGNMGAWVNPSSIDVDNPEHDLSSMFGGTGINLPNNGGWLAFGVTPACTQYSDGTFYIDNVYIVPGQVTDLQSLTSCDSPGAAAALNECEAQGKTCTDQGQTCNDPNPTVNQIDDWVCECGAGFSGPAGMQAASTMCAADALNECEAQGKTCTDQGQTCNDPNPTVNQIDDWVCECGAGFSGPAGMQAASTMCMPDALDECETVGSGVCSRGQNQICVDAVQSAASMNDWVCRCAAGYSGSDGMRVTAVCVADDLDECAAGGRVTCMAGQNQACVDPVPKADALDDWVCRCDNGYFGADGLRTATMCMPSTLNECASDGDSVCAQGTNQTCVDPSQTLASTNDWICRCDSGFTGADGMQAATVCTADDLNECIAAGNAVCAQGTNQACVDPKPTATSVGDWVCRCGDVATGADGLQAVATCTRRAFDECGDGVKRGVCEGAVGQGCVDPAPFADSLDDWECRCAAGYAGSAGLARAASCVLDLAALDECSNAIIAAVCEDSDQTCVDPDATVDDNWECRCTDGHTGSAARGPAACTLSEAPPLFDECTEVCATCANGTCGAAGQKCVEDNMNTTSLGDWSCVCEFPAKGVSVVGGAATCAVKVFPADTHETLSTSNERATVAGVVAAAVAGTGLPMHSGKLAIARSLSCEIEDVDVGSDELDFEFHPLGVGIGDARVQYRMGAAILNWVFIFGVLLLCVLVGAVFTVVTKAGWGHVTGVLRTPGIVYIPFIFVLQGTSLAASQLLFNSGSAGVGYAVFGGFILTLVCACIVLIHVFIVKRVDAEASAVDDPLLHAADGSSPRGFLRILYVFAFGSTIWVEKPNAQDPWFVEHYGVIFEGFRPGRLWVVDAELASVLAVSLLSSWVPATMSQCSVRNALLCVVLLVFLLILLKERPYVASMDNTIAIVLAATVCGSVIMLSVATVMELPPESSVIATAAWLLVASSYVLIAKAVWDIFVYLVDVYLSRQREARRAASEHNNSYHHLMQLIDATPNMPLVHRVSSGASAIEYTTAKVSGVGIDCDGSAGGDPFGSASGVYARVSSRAGSSLNSGNLNFGDPTSMMALPSSDHLSPLVPALPMLSNISPGAVRRAGEVQLPSSMMDASLRTDSHNSPHRPAATREFLTL